MPVYIRKNVSYTPPSIDKIPAEQEDDFINDPELLRDDLPQPYRMIDKTLKEFLDDTWEVIAQREAERLAEAQKVRPPQYDFNIQLEEPIPGTQRPEKQTLAYATSMCESPDGFFVFIGMPFGITVLDAFTQQFLASWEDENAEITYMKAYKFNTQMYLIVTIDDMGIGRLFAFSSNKLFLIRVLNSNPQDSDNKVLVSKLEASLEGDYVGLVMENPSNQELWLEVHKLPKETWVNDLDTMIQALKKKEEKNQEMQESADTESVVASEVAGSQVDAQEPSIASLQSTAPLDTADNTQDPLSGDFKFASTQLIMKVKPPTPISGVTISSLQSSLQKVEGADVVGTGQNTIFTQAHLDLRQSVFDHLHDNLLRYLPEDEEEAEKLQQYPNFHFLTAGRMLPSGLEQASLDGKPTVVAVWWPGSTNFMHYSLIKTSKDVEFKPDIVWPFTCKITCTEVSPDTNLIAVGLDNGNVVIWDKYMGCQRGVVTVRDDSPIVQLKFLDPSLYPQDTSRLYETGRSTYLLVMCANSALYTVTTTPCQPLHTNLISLPVDKDDDTITLLHPFLSNPDLLLTVTRKGSIQIRDTLLGTILLQVRIPDKFEIPSPWDPVLALSGSGHILYVKGVKKQEEEEELEGTTLSGSIFVYKLKVFPTLDEYWKVQRTSLSHTVHTKVDQRVDTFFSQRILQQRARKERMQTRWEIMKEEISHIQKMKEEARNKAEARNIVLPLP